MTYKVAIGTNDDENVNVHFGKAEKFLIYLINDDGYEFVEKRTVNPSCVDDGDHSSLRDIVIKSISDVDAVVVSNVGPGAIDDLIIANIRPFATLSTIDEALDELVEIFYSSSDNEDNNQYHNENESKSCSNDECSNESCEYNNS
ncbi:MAG: dinitrogenase iron-molybdenum cofactor biosynthesis protein [Methanobrevibacter sp.]|jgi:predicted Fe-Mo cluster-binding NifX family protein|nr:dinitrogenase iron-molybdenum cofactor biosynthesis protein [Candidatus Methanoflexus mossambicus]